MIIFVNREIVSVTLLSPPLPFIGRTKTIMAHWLSGQKRIKAFDMHSSTYISRWKITWRGEFCAYRSAYALSLLCICSTADVLSLHRCSTFVVMYDITALVMRSYCDKIATVMRNQCVNVTATALRMPAKLQREHCDAWEWKAKARKKHCDSTATIHNNFWPATALHSHATPLQQMQKHWEFRATFHCKVTAIWGEFFKTLAQCCRYAFASPVWLGYNRWTAN